MPESVRLIDPHKIRPNPENPRLIFRQEELDSLQESISKQGILVPLTVYEGRRGVIYILDGERRWRCALKLGLKRVPVILQPEPDRLQNIMMMFAIHNTRKHWDPLPTAFKLRDLEQEFQKVEGRRPTEATMAELASISRGEVRRLKKLLNLPKKYRDMLLEELAKPRSEQAVTADHVLEATNGAAALRKREVIDHEEEDALRETIIDKFRSGTINNTVAPRKLARIARAVERDEVSKAAARRVVRKLIKNANYDIDDAFSDSVEQVDFEHSTEQLAVRLSARLDEHLSRGYEASDSLRDALRSLVRIIKKI